MMYGRTIFGKWAEHHVNMLAQHGISVTEGYAMFGIEENDLYFKIIEQLKDAPEFSDRRSIARFDAQELRKSTTYLMHGLGLGPALAYPARLGKEDDGDEYLRFAFGEICKRCNRILLGEQIQPSTLEKEPKLGKKYLWGSFHGVSGYLFTDRERFALLNDTWGIGAREVLIGSRQWSANNFVQLDIPVAQSPLFFGESSFGQTFATDRSGNLSEQPEYCPGCGRALFTNKILDFFPAFEQEAYEFDLVFTQEWFGWYRRLVVSKKFAQWFVDHKFGKWDSNYFIPVKSFKP